MGKQTQENQKRPFFGTDGIRGIKFTEHFAKERRNKHKK